MRSQEAPIFQTEQHLQNKDTSFISPKEAARMLNLANAIEQTDPQRAMQLRQLAWGHGDYIMPSTDD